LECTVNGINAAELTVVDGDDLVEALADELEGRSGWVVAVGRVHEVELRLVETSGDAVRALDGCFVLVSLGGPAGGPYTVLLASADGTGQRLVAGQLVRARCESVSAAVLPFAGVASGAGAPSAPEHPPVPPPGASAWAVAAAAAAEEMEADEPRYRPERGDRVHHFAFGLCDVLTAEGDSLRIRESQGPGRVREIRIDMLTVLPPKEKDGKRVFKLIRRQ
jgi:hypothetical protein